MPGGMAQVNILTSLIFSGMSGSAVSDAAGVGKVVTDMMLKDNRYPPGYAGALTAATAVVGPIFPPSIPMVYYALVSSASIGALFLGGVVPALLIVLLQGIAAYITAKRRGFSGGSSDPLPHVPADHPAGAAGAVHADRPARGIYTGIFTPTEAAAVSAFYALLLAVFAYRSLTLKEFAAVVLSTVKTTAVVTVVLCGAFIFNYVIAIERIPQMVYEVFSYYQMEPWVFLLVLNILYLILGCILDVSTIQLVITPLFIPTAMALGIDLVHLGVVLVFNMMIGLITPPYGVLLFIIKALNGIPLARHDPGNLVAYRASRRTSVPDYLCAGAGALASEARRRHAMIAWRGAVAAARGLRAASVVAPAPGCRGRMGRGLSGGGGRLNPQRRQVKTAAMAAAPPKTRPTEVPRLRVARMMPIRVARPSRSRSPAPMTVSDSTGRILPKGMGSATATASRKTGKPISISAVRPVSAFRRPGRIQPSTRVTSGAVWRIMTSTVDAESRRRRRKRGSQIERLPAMICSATSASMEPNTMPNGPGIGIMAGSARKTMAKARLVGPRASSTSSMEMLPCPRASSATSARWAEATPPSLE